MLNSLTPPPHTQGVSYLPKDTAHTRNASLTWGECHAIKGGAAKGRTKGKDLDEEALGDEALRRSWWSKGSIRSGEALSGPGLYVVKSSIQALVVKGLN